MSNEKENILPSEDQTPETIQPSPAEQFPVEEGTATGAQQTETLEARRKFKLTWQHVVGFLGWFLVFGAMWWMVTGGERADEETILIGNIIGLPANLLVLLVLAIIKKTRQIAQGILAAWGFNFIISLILNLGYNAFCLVPFFN